MTTTTQAQPVVRQLLNPQEASAYMGGKPTPNTLAQWRSQRRGPKFVKLGKLVRYERTAIDAWLAANTHTGTGNTGAQSY